MGYRWCRPRMQSHSINFTEGFFLPRDKHLWHPGGGRSGRGGRKSRTLYIPPVLNAHPRVTQSEFFIHVYYMAPYADESIMITLRRFDTIPERYGRTDRRTSGQNCYRPLSISITWISYDGVLQKALVSCHYVIIKVNARDVTNKLNKNSHESFEKFVTKCSNSYWNVAILAILSHGSNGPFTLLLRLLLSLRCAYLFFRQ